MYSCCCVLVSCGHHFSLTHSTPLVLQRMCWCLLPWIPAATTIGCAALCGFLELRMPAFDIAKAQVGQGNNTIVYFTDRCQAIQVCCDCRLLIVGIRISCSSYVGTFPLLLRLNIAESDRGDYFTVLFHFRPCAIVRCGQVVINDKKEYIWG